MKKWKTRKESLSGLAFVGCLFIGGGFGMLYNQVAAGWLIGLGAGFIAMAIVRMKCK